jgi:phosphotransacetylase
MYTADCKFGGILRGTSAPVVFMSRADSTETRLNSLALALRFLDHERFPPGLRDD